jgi:hypothetical protein
MIGIFIQIHHNRKNIKFESFMDKTANISDFNTKPLVNLEQLFDIEELEKEQEHLIIEGLKIFKEVINELNTMRRQDVIILKLIKLFV